MLFGPLVTGSDFDVAIGVHFAKGFGVASELGVHGTDSQRAWAGEGHKIK